MNKSKSKSKSKINKKSKINNKKSKIKRSVNKLTGGGWLDVPRYFISSKNNQKGGGWGWYN